MKRTVLSVMAFCTLVRCNDAFSPHSEAADPSGQASGLTELEGKLVFIHDGDSGDYFLYSDRRWTALDLASEPTIAVNSTVRVVGHLDSLKGTLAVEEMTKAAGGPTAEDGIAAVTRALSEESTAEALSDGTVAVIVIKDTNVPDNEAYTESEVREVVFGVPADPNNPNGDLMPDDKSANAFFQEVSFGDFRLSGDIYMGYEIDMDVENCNFQTVQNWLEMAIEHHEIYNGLNPNGYSHIVGVYQRRGTMGDCDSAGGRGTGSNPEGPAKVWAYSTSAQVCAHELGHNLDLGHANKYNCSTLRGLVPTSMDCISIEYDDANDTMGGGGVFAFHHFNAHTKMLLGWIDEASVAEVSENGVYSLAPQETEESNYIQSILIPIPGGDDFYHLELRKRYGFDDDTRLDDVVLLRRVKNRKDSTLLILPAQPYGISHDGLQVGRPFVDPTTGITIELLGIDPPDPLTTPPTPQIARVQITFGGPSCVDGVKNGDEGDIDCGGRCEQCEVGASCNTSVDCESADCIDGVCEAAEGGLTAKFFLTIMTDGPVKVSRSPVVDFEWGAMDPTGSLNTLDYSMEWSGSIVPVDTDNYTFHIYGSNHVELTIDGRELIDGDTGAATELSSVPIYLEAGQAYPIRLRYSDADAAAVVRLLWSGDIHPEKIVVPRSRFQPLQGGLTGEYWAGITPGSDPDKMVMSRIDNMLAMSWPGRPPHESLEFGNFSVRWTGQLVPRYSETYTFYLSMLDKGKLWIDDQLIIEKADFSGASGKIALSENIPVDIRVELYNDTSIIGTQRSAINLSWSSDSQPKEKIPDTQLIPTTLGDVNSDGAVNLTDAEMTAQYVVGLRPIRFNSGAADVNSNGTVDIIDALIIAQKYAGVIPDFFSYLNVWIQASVSPPMPQPPVELPVECNFYNGGWVPYLLPTADDFGDSLEVGDFVYLTQDGPEYALEVRGVNDGNNQFFFSSSYQGSTGVYAPCSKYKMGSDDMGVISPIGDGQYARGEDHLFSAAPDPGFHLEDLIVDGESKGRRQLDYIFQNVQKAHTIEAVFGEGEIPIFEIMINAIGEGSTNLGGNIRFHEGEDVSVTFIPNEGQSVEDVIIDGVRQGPISEYSWTGLDADHLIDVSFVPVLSLN